MTHDQFSAAEPYFAAALDSTESGCHARGLRRVLRDRGTHGQVARSAPRFARAFRTRAAPGVGAALRNHRRARRRHRVRAQAYRAAPKDPDNARQVAELYARSACSSEASRNSRPRNSTRVLALSALFRREYRAFATRRASRSSKTHMISRSNTYSRSPQRSSTTHRMRLSDSSKGPASGSIRTRTS